jgi:hypothetical protein
MQFSFGDLEILTGLTGGGGLSACQFEDFER